jgi:protein-S-isoprenylcysteine O-methyltransferase Ste14
MGSQLSPYPCSDRASRIVQTGVYGLVRHPLYGCLMSFGFGWALVWSSPTAVALAFAHALALLGKARVEEVLIVNLMLVILGARGRCCAAPRTCLTWTGD